MYFFRRLGAALMLPVAVLPAAGILMGLGHWIEFLSSGQSQLFSQILIQAGNAIMDFLPLLFSVGIAYGLSKDRSGHAAISGLIAFLVIERVLTEDLVALIHQIEIHEVSVAFSARNNAFIGIVSGVIASSLYNFLDVFWPFPTFKFYNAQNISMIATVFVTLLFAVFFSYVWPIVYEGMLRFGMYISRLGSLGAGVFGFLNRLLIPLGLHHALNSVFWFDTIGINDIGKFWGQIEGGVRGLSGMYQAGFYPVMMFGLPGAALAIYRNAFEENKTKIGSLMLAAALASFVTGITEPLEFSFMFVAFELYLVHAFLTGLALLITSVFSWTAGFTFSAGFIDFILSSKMPLANQPYMLILLGVLYFVLYYALFNYLIKKYQYQTPGREPERNIPKEEKEFIFEENYDFFAKELMSVIGGKENILHIDQCTTRLRIELRDIEKVNFRALEKLPTAGMRIFGKNNLQLIIGPQVQFVADALRKALKS